MSLPPPSLDPVPEDTARIAHAVFPKGNLAVTVRDVLSTIFHDGMFADLYSDHGQPGIAPWRLALEAVAAAAPDWLVQQVPPAWEERYRRRVEEYRLPSSEAAREALAVQIGQDGVQVLAAVQAADAPRWLREVPMVQRLQRVWDQQ